MNEIDELLGVCERLQDVEEERQLVNINCVAYHLQMILEVIKEARDTIPTMVHAQVCSHSRFIIEDLEDTR